MAVFRLRHQQPSAFPNWTTPWHQRRARPFCPADGGEQYTFTAFCCPCVCLDLVLCVRFGCGFRSRLRFPFSFSFVDIISLPNEGTPFGGVIQDIRHYRSPAWLAAPRFPHWFVLQRNEMARSKLELPPGIYTGMRPGPTTLPTPLPPPQAENQTLTLMYNMFWRCLPRVSVPTLETSVPFVKY